MITGFVIRQSHEGLPMFFSARAGRELGGGGGGWVGEPNEALMFARAKDAQEFIDVYLVPLAPFCNVIAHTTPTT
jgi:hypothetical protein